MLETPNLARKYKPTCSFRKYTFQCFGSVNFAGVSIVFAKNYRFCPKNYLYSKEQCESCVKDFLVLFAVIVKQKVAISENITFAGSVSRIRPQDCSKLANNPKNDNDVTTFRHDTIVKVFLAFFVCLVKFSYWSMFHVNIITDTGIMIIFFYKGLTRNPEIRNIPV